MAHTQSKAKTPPGKYYCHLNHQQHHSHRSMLQPLPGLAALCKSSPYCNSTSCEGAFALFTDGQRTQENPAPWWRQDLDHAAELCGLHRLPPHSGSDHCKGGNGRANCKTPPSLPKPVTSCSSPSPQGQHRFPGPIQKLS